MKFRPDLSAYEVYIATATDLLNQDSFSKLSKTDFVKMAVEKALKTVLPNTKIKPKRKRFVRVDY